MIDGPDEDVPVQVASIAVVCGIAVCCPACGEAVQFDLDEIRECEAGTFGVSDTERFQWCGGCGAFVDYGAVRFQVLSSH